MTNPIHPVHFHVTWQGAEQAAFDQLKSFDIEVDNQKRRVDLWEYSLLPQGSIKLFTFSDNTSSIQLQKSVDTTVAISISVLKRFCTPKGGDSCTTEICSNHPFSVQPGGYYEIALCGEPAESSYGFSLGKITCSINESKLTIPEQIESVVASLMYSRNHTYRQQTVDCFLTSIVGSYYTMDEISAYQPTLPGEVSQNEFLCRAFVKQSFERNRVIREGTVAGQLVMEPFKANHKSLEETKEAIKAFSSIVARALTYQVLAVFLIEQKKYQEARQVIALIPDGRIMEKNIEFHNPKEMTNMYLQSASTTTQQ